MIAWLTALLLAAAPAAAQPVCNAADLPALAACLRAPAPNTRIAITRDLVCRSAAECCPGGQAPLRVSNTPGLTIDGQGHTLRREAGQKLCQSLVVRRAPNLTLANPTFDEDRAAIPCELAEKTCPPTLDIGWATDMTMDRVRVLFGKGYVVKLWGVHGFAMRRSEVADAGIIAFSAGDARFAPTSRITVEDSRFLRARTNAIATMGADDLVIRRNRFQDNHWHGLWPTATVAGGITPGGQVFVAQGNRVTIEGNTFTGNDCGNCTPSKLVTALEIGGGRDKPGVADLIIADNRICYTGRPGWAVYHNPGSPEGTARLSNNRVSGYAAVDNMRGPVARAGNQVGKGDTCG